MDIKKPIMKEYMSERNKHELDGHGQYYEMGIKKLASFKNAKHRAKKINLCFRKERIIYLFPLFLCLYVSLMLTNVVFKIKRS